MKQLIIYIEIHEKRPFNFENRVLMQIKKKYPDKLILDLDNFSSPDLFKHTEQACDHSKNISLIINSKEKDLPLGQVLNFINKSLRKKDLLIDSYLLGEHSIAKKMLQRTNSFTVCDEIV